ncbi:hypothetical protein HDU97_000942 [Phlyctochytrium planicorne]|nr:hypothetical protein HDU97_000942 [Phlyctochytrium planicorne]
MRLSMIMNVFIALCFLLLTTTTVLSTPLPSDPSTNVTLARRASADENGILQAHNQVRQQYKKSAMSWDASFASQARSYAQRLANNNCRMQHSTKAERPGQGENLYMSSGGGAGKPMRDAVPAFCSNVEKDQWFKRRQYNHFSQVVWGESKKLGCGKAVGRGGCVIVVCSASILIAARTM